MSDIKIEDGFVHVPLRTSDAQMVVIRWATGKCPQLVMPLAFARELYNDLGEHLAKRTPDADAQVQEERDVVVRAYGIALARVEVLAKDNSKLSEELYRAQEEHGAAKRELDERKAKSMAKKRALVDALGLMWHEGMEYVDAVRQMRYDLRDVRAAREEAQVKVVDLANDVAAAKRERDARTAERDDARRDLRDLEMVHVKCGSPLAAAERECKLAAEVEQLRAERDEALSRVHETDDCTEALEQARVELAELRTKALDIRQRIAAIALVAGSA